MKNLTHYEAPETVTVWLLVLLTPINPVLQSHRLCRAGRLALWLLLGAGLLTALGQYLLTLAYNAADAAYVQPFDDLKLPLNVFARLARLRICAERISLAWRFADSRPLALPDAARSRKGSLPRILSG